MGKRGNENGSYWQNMRAYEKGLLEWALAETGDSPIRAAEMLGINASYFYERCKITGIHRPGKGKQADDKTADAVATPTPKLKLVRAAAPAPEVGEDDEEVVDDENEDVEDETASEDGDDSVEVENAVTGEAVEEEDDDAEDDEEEYVEEEVPDDECLCGAKLVTDDERLRWVECSTCRTNRLTNATNAVPATMPDDEEELA